MSTDDDDNNDDDYEAGAMTIVLRTFMFERTKNWSKKNQINIGLGQGYHLSILSNLFKSSLSSFKIYDLQKWKNISDRRESNSHYF